MSNTTPEPTPTGKDETATTDGRGKPSGTDEASPVMKPTGRGKPS